MDEDPRETKRRLAREWYAKRRDEAPPEVRELWRQEQREANALSYQRHRKKRLAKHRSYLRANKDRVNEYFRRYRELNRERLRECQARRREEHREEVNAYNRAYQKAHFKQYRAYKRAESQRPKVAARVIVGLAVKAGLIEKPDGCERCGTPTPKNRLHGHHHHGYEAAHILDVQWLCSICHGKAHRSVDDGSTDRRTGEDVGAERGPTSAPA